MKKLKKTDWSVSEEGAPLPESKKGYGYLPPLPGFFFPAFAFAMMKLLSTIVVGHTFISTPSIGCVNVLRAIG